MKTKAGTCCTSASRAAGRTERTASAPGPRRPIPSPCNPGPNSRDDDPAPARPPDQRQRRGGAGQFLADANGNRMIDTGTITCNEEYLLGTELLYIRGPFSLQAEYGWNFLNNAQITVRVGRNRSRTTCSTADTSKWRIR